MNITSLSTSAHTAYHDLRNLVLNETVMEIRGKLVKRDINGKTYWYDHYRVGTTTKDRYIGEDCPEIETRLKRATRLKQALPAQKSKRSTLVRLLRAEGMLSVDRKTGSLLKAFSEAGVFRVGGVLVGTQAFRLYEGELGVKLPAGDTSVTDDIDIAGFERLTLAIGDSTNRTPGSILEDLEFEPIPTLDNQAVWKWRQSGSGAEVEFLTPSFEENEGIRPLKSLNVSARALHHLNFLIAEPIYVVGLYREGILVRTPRPERYAIHKLIIADRRRRGPDSLKSRKDRAQAAFLIRVLAEDRPYELKGAWDTARAAGPKWRDRLDASLARMPEEKAILDGLA